MINARLKSVEIVFENCEMLEVDSSDIEDLHLMWDKGDLQKDRSSNKLNKAFYLDSAIIKIKNSGNLEYEWAGCLNTSFKRILAYNDITQIYLKYEDGSEDAFYVQWPETDEKENSKQQVILRSDGLLILISPVSRGNK